MTNIDTRRWRQELLTKEVAKRGKPPQLVVTSVLANVITILRFHRDWAGVLAWDAFAEKIVTTRPPPWAQAAAPSDVHVGTWQDSDTARVVDWMQRHEGINVSARIAADAIVVVAECATVHPVRAYLKSLVWDGEERLPTWLSTYCGAAQTRYTAAVGARWLISAVARVMRPGCQVDNMLILEGERQGTQKSSAFRTLVPEPTMYSETGIQIGNKDSYQALHGVWIYLLDELDSIRRSDVTKTKNFISSMKDRYRPSYGRLVRDVPRQNVFCGTTNERNYLVDKTGNRRYWPVSVVHEIDIAGLARARDQLWAEAVVRYERGDKWYIDSVELRELCEREQAQRTHDDPWLPTVARWLANPTKPVCINDPDERVPWTVPDGGVSTTEVLLYALNVRPERMTRVTSMRVADVLRQLGWTQVSRPRTDPSRTRRYAKPANVASTLSPEDAP